MTTSTTKLITILAIAASLLSANAAFAHSNGKNGGNGGNKNGGNNGGFKITFGGNPPRLNQSLNHNNNNNNNNNNCNNNQCNNQNGGQNCGGDVFGAQALEPFHSTYIVQPGDSFYTVSLKEYRTGANSKYIAQFNRLPLTSALVPGQRLVLPAVGANGSLTQSRSPAADGDVTPVAFGTNSPATRNLTSSFFGAGTTAPATNNKPATTESRTKIAVGSTLLVDGQTFGDKQGVAHLRVSGLSLPVEVLEWSSSAVKIRLPQVEVTTATFADIEVVRADSSLASKTAVELTKATEQLALSK